MSTPRARAVAAAWARRTTVPCVTKLLMSLAAWPVPGSPKRRTTLDHDDATASTRGQSPSRQPTKEASSPRSASGGPPVTGASA